MRHSPELKVTDADLADCEALLIPGEADARQIEDLIAGLRAPVEAVEPIEAETVETVEVAMIDVVESVDEGAVPAAAEDSNVDIISVDRPVASNRIQADGRTH